MSTSGSSSSELVFAAAGSSVGAFCAPRGGITDTDRECLLQALGPGAVLHCCGAASEAVAWIGGRLDNADRLARELGLPAGPPEAVVLAGWRRFGDALFPRLRGSFLLLLWDPERRATLLVVDQLGSASPYVHRRHGRVALATDAAVLQQLTPLTPDDVSVSHWLVSDTPAVGRTLFADVELLLGGTYMTIDDRGVRTTTYWRPRYSEPPRIGVDEASSLMWERLRASVRRRIGEERRGVIMSGGVDSTSVAAAATTVSSDVLHAFSAVFPGRGVDESERIDAVVDALDLSSVQVSIEPAGAFALSLDYLERWSVPLNGAGYLLEYPLLAEAAAAGVAAVLDGQGGDELFAVSGFLLADRVARGRLVSSAQLTRRLPGARRKSRRQILGAWRHYVQGGLVPYALHAALKRQRARVRADRGWLLPATYELLIDTDHSLDWKRSVNAPLWWTHKAYLLTRAREEVRIAEYLNMRAIMAGLRAAPPLLDVDLVEAALQIPPEIEFEPDLDRPLIRRATRGLIPDAVRLSLRKSNLAPFYFEVAAGRDLPAVRAVLKGPDLRIGRFVDAQSVRELVDHPPAADAGAAWSWQSEVWRLATTECWLRHLESPAAVTAMLAGVELERPSWRIHRRRTVGTHPRAKRNAGL